VRMLPEHSAITPDRAKKSEARAQQIALFR
jgi:hypothetical protein